MGKVNGHIIGRILKETVRRATTAIQSERLIFDAKAKEGYTGNMDDVFTSADTKAQEIYLRAFTECFPEYGVIGEEGSLVIQPKRKNGPYFTVDSLDGTKAFVRRQSHGVGTMVALVHGKKVISAYVGDINTNEVYGFRPDSDTVHRITQLDTVETLKVEPDTHPKKKYALLRNPLAKYSAGAQGLVGQFKDHEVIGSSIGTWMAMLWKREVGALFLGPGIETPWDSTPIIGISKKLGYLFLRPDVKGGSNWDLFDPPLPKEAFHRNHEMMVIHGRDLEHLKW